MFFFCRDDNKVQPGHVCQDEGKEERASLQPREDGGACHGERDSRHSSYLHPRSDEDCFPSHLSGRDHPTLKESMCGNKGKENADSRLSIVWDDAGLALTRAQDTFTAKELKVLSSVPSNKIVGRYIHKLIYVMYFGQFTFFFCLSLYFLFLFLFFMILKVEERPHLGHG